MIMKVGEDMLAFLFVFIMINLIFTILNTNLDNSFLELYGNMSYEWCGETCEESFDESFTDRLFKIALLSFISNDGYFEQRASKSNTHKIIAFVQIIFAIVMLLNLLISIVGNTFDEVVENSIASDS
jgi:hypothetical protein